MLVRCMGAESETVLPVLALLGRGGWPAEDASFVFSRIAGLAYALFDSRVLCSLLLFSTGAPRRAAVGSSTCLHLLLLLVAYVYNGPRTGGSLLSRGSYLYTGQVWSAVAAVACGRWLPSG